MSQAIDQAIKLLRSDKDDVRRSGEEQLDSLATSPFSDADIDAILDAALTPFTEIKGETTTPQGILLFALRGQQSLRLVDAISERFSKFEASLQEQAVSILVRIDSPKAIDTVVDLICSGKPKEPISFEWDAEEALPNNPSTRVSHLMRLLDCTTEEVVRDNLLMATLFRLQSLKRPADALDDLRAMVLAEYRQNADRLQSSQSLTTNSQRSASENFALRRRIGVILDIFGYLADAETLSLLRDALKLSDPRHRSLALLSLVRRGNEVAAQDIERIAADVDTRALLFDALKSLDRLSLLPAAY